MKKTLVYILVAGLTTLSLDAADKTPETASSEMAIIDSQLKELKQARDVAARNARLADDRADRSIDRDWLAYRRSLAIQQHAEEQVKELDAKISELEKKKAALEASQSR